MKKEDLSEGMLVKQTFRCGGTVPGKIYTVKKYDDSTIYYISKDKDGCWENRGDPCCNCFYNWKKVDPLLGMVEQSKELHGRDNIL